MIKAYLQLMRPANIITAIADILLGFAISGAIIEIIDQGNGWFYVPQAKTLGWLILSTVGLYGGGVVFNDVFDANLDSTERPERPIPSKRASKGGATILGSILLFIGIACASQVSATSGVIALIVGSLAIIYDAWGKHQTLIGPINMGACRGGNLLLGVSAVTSSLSGYWFVALVPIIYIAAITAISRGEVFGGNRKAMTIAVYMYLTVILFILSLSYIGPHPVWQSVPFLVLFCYLIFPALLKARRYQQGSLIGKAVKAGVIALIVMDATIAVGFAGWSYGLLILLLLPISIIIAKGFAVT